MMKSSKAWAALTIIVSCLGTSSQTVWAQTSGHDHSSHHEAEVGHLKFNNGKKWSTDAILRLGMERIRDAMSTEKSVMAHGKMSAKQYRTLARQVNEQISFMVQNCKLDKQADAMLHLILAELVAGADAISASDDEHSMHQGAEKIARALQDYAAYFEHPGWQQ